MSMNAFMVNGWYCGLGWGYFGVSCVTCVPCREKVAGDTIASMIDGAFPVLLTQHKLVRVDQILNCDKINNETITPN